MNNILKILLPILITSLTQAADLEWTGNGDAVSFYQEANWQLQGGGAVPADPLSPNTSITDNLIFTGNNPSIASQLTLAAPTTLQISAGTLIMAANGGISGGSITLSNNSDVQTNWMNNSTATITQSTLTLRGTGNPLTNTTITCTGTQWSITFTNQNNSTVKTQHLSKITINGQPATIGTNCGLTQQTANTSVLAPLTDTDNDQLADYWELQYFGNLDQNASADPDNDQLTNLQEQALSTNPTLADTDNDGITDKAETNTGSWTSLSNTGTDPLNPDSDEDGLPDGVETNTGTYVNGTDTGTNPHLFNTDGDRIGDGAEVARNTDPTNSSQQPNLPNIIFIMADDLGYNHLSSYGQQRLATPHIDALATQGIRFTDAYAGCTVCGPSRSSLLTGIHSGHIPYKPNSGFVDITSRTKTIAELLKQAGYINGMFGKWGVGGLGSGQTPNERGFDKTYCMLDQGHGHRHFPSYLVEDNTKSPLGNTTDANGNTSSNPANRNKHTHDAFTDKTLEFIENQKNNAFFCYLAFTLPHTEIIASDEVLNTPEFAPENWPENYTANTSAHIRQTQPHRNFGAEIRMIDNSVGAIVAKLEDPNGDGDTSDSITNNTLVIFTSDNGGQLQAVWGSAPSIYFNANGILRGGKEDSYEGGLRVPMIAKWPGKITPGTTSDLPTYFADFLPTICEIASIKPPKYTDGLSILPTLKGNTADQKIHPYLFWSHQANRLDHAIRAGKWKAVKRGNNSIELFNLETDPSESTNVASSNPTIIADMQKIIAREYTPDLPKPNPSANSPIYPNFP